LPPAEAMAQLREMEETQQTISRLESHIRGMSVPTQDRVWWRFRQEQALLGALLNFDLGLIRASEQLYQVVSQVSAESWQAYGAGLLTPYIQQLSHLANEREQFLLLQV
ncbi:MAG TPA: hypothetical protein VFN35_32860, partial [Ktedonobacteraceae bacterium]|nr:hypothetical protein [Ktedonobacteraceae bacterium]